MKKLRIDKLFSQQTVRQASGLVISATILAKVLGFIRETAIARSFGVTSNYDVFLISYTFPSLIIVILTYGVSKAITPFYHKIRVELGDYQASKYAKQLIVLGEMVLITITIVSIVAFKHTVTLFIPSASIQEQNLAVQLFQILILLIPLFYGVISFRTFLQADSFFLVTVIGPLLLHPVVIAFVLLGSSWGITSLAWGWVFGTALQLMWLAVAYFRSLSKTEVTRNGGQKIPTSWMRKVTISIVLVVFVEIWGQLFIVVDRLTIQYLFLPSGSIAALSYARVLYNLPLSMFALAIGQVLFPFLSAHVASGHTEAQFTLLSKGVRSTLIIIIPLATMLIVMPEIIVSLTYERGIFDANATIMTAQALQVYALALLPYSIYAILVGYFYAIRAFRILIIAAMVAFISKGILNLILAPDWGLVGIVMATVIAGFILVGILAIWLRAREKQFLHKLGLFSLGVKGLLAVLPGVIITIFFLQPFLSKQIELISNTTLFNLLTLLLTGGLLATSYFVIATLLQVPELVAVNSIWQEKLFSR